ncbi:putative disease resistance protein [Citrus sinensis]|uniref:Disease resistance protein n=1 Tax=Citrus sinensis TaxID=2711 RepID=A0ACB8JCU7_CITSI|nr:putative disease resistance protein [Citrus sinensis]
MESIGKILEILKYTVPPIRQYGHNHRKLKENMKNLERVLQELNSQKEDIEATLKLEGDQGKRPRSEVNNWLQNVQRINSEAQGIEQEVNKGKYFSRACLDKLVEEKIAEAEEYHQKGCSFTSLAIDAPPTSGLMLPTTTALAGENARKIMEKIWEDLLGEKVSKIGVWVALNQNLPATENKERRAGMLLRMLEAKERSVLILDDMWEAFALEEIGIPEPSKENGCKMVITTRSLGVCRSMGCKEIGVELLSQEEALSLFLNKVGRSILQVPTLSEEIINSVVEECAGIPLVIVTVAGCMRGVDEIHEWRNALNELRGCIRSLNGVDSEVFGRLQFSYHRLKDKKVQQCFLYYALYPEDYPIPKDDLIGYWIAEGFIEEVNNVQEKYDRGHTILNRLVNCCLLESDIDGGGFVRMHDLIRDMALRITSDSPLFMVKAGVCLLEFPSEQEWKENLERGSLMGNGIQEIPSNMSPHCEILSTLLLQSNRNLPRIPDRFFIIGASLLSKIRASSLFGKAAGSSVVGPRRNKHKGSPRSLRLYLGSETLRETVEEAARLSNRLDTFHATFSKPNDFNICVKSSVGRGSRRFHFAVANVGSRRSKMLFRSRHHLSSWFIMQAKVNKSVSIIGCKVYDDTIVLPKGVECLVMMSISDVTNLDDVLLREQSKLSHLKVLYLSDCVYLKKLSSLQLLPALQNLEVLRVDICYRIEEIVAVDEEEIEKELGTNMTITVTLPRLKKLVFSDLPELKSVCGDNAVLVCNSLQEIEVSACPKLKRLSLLLPLLDNGQPSPLPALQGITIDEQLWESLQWDQTNAKDVLNPYCKFEKARLFNT